MKRKEFIKTGMSFGAALGATSALGANESQSGQQTGNHSKFKLNYAPHFGMFSHHAKGKLDQVRFGADQGFTAWEDNRMMKRSLEFQKQFANLMQKLGMTMGVFVSYSGFSNNDMMTKTDKAYQDHLRKSMRKAMEVAKQVNAQWSTVVPGKVNLKLAKAYQTANLVENLKVMAEVCEKHQHTMVLEPLNWWSNHPGLFLTEIPQAYSICKAVGSPSCKILDDLYHQQISEGNLIPNMDKAWSEIAYFQVGDNPGRKEPTTGEINYRNIFAHLASKDYKGIIGMEHGNSKKGKAGEDAVIAAYRYCDSFA